MRTHDAHGAGVVGRQRLLLGEMNKRAIRTPDAHGGVVVRKRLPVEDWMKEQRAVVVGRQLFDQG